VTTSLFRLSRALGSLIAICHSPAEFALNKPRSIVERSQLVNLLEAFGGESA
jgi:hypothetical protein